MNGVPMSALDSAAFPIDFSALDGETLRDLELIYKTEAIAQAMVAEQMLAELRREHRDKVRAVDGMGERTQAVPAILRGIAAADGESFNDPSYAKFIGKKYPETVVRSGGTKLQFGYTGGLPGNCVLGMDPVPVNPKRYTKTYAG